MLMKEIKDTDISGSEHVNLRTLKEVYNDITDKIDDVNKAKGNCDLIVENSDNNITVKLTNKTNNIEFMANEIE